MATPAAAPSASHATSAWLTSLLLLIGVAAGSRQSVADESPPVDDFNSLEGTAALTQPADSSRQQALLDHYEHSLAIRQYQEAETAAKQRIEYLIGTGGSAGLTMAEALSDLAFAQRLSEQYDAAAQNYFASISLLVRSENMLSDKLIEPLRGLGDTYMASGQADLALPVYQRALHLNHVNDGPHNLDQVEILDAMILAEMQASRPDDALGVVDRISALHMRRFASDSEEMLPVLERRADLLKRLGRYQDERLVYLDIVRIIEGHRGESDVSLIEPYTALGRTFLHEVGEVIFRSEPTAETGETFLKKAVEVARSSPDSTLLMQEKALIGLGDYYMILDVQDKARRNYRQAWELLSSDDSYLEQRRQDFEKVALLIRPKIDRYANFGYRSGAEEGDAAYIEGHVVAQFKVNDRGRVADIEIVEAVPSDFTAMEIRVQRVLRESVYRPRLEDGRPVIAENQQFRHDFLYLGE